MVVWQPPTGRPYLGSSSTGNIVLSNNTVFNGNLTLGTDTIADFTGNGLALSAMP